MEYKSLTESHRSMDDVLRFVLVKEGVDELKFRGLNESSRKQISNEMMSSMIQSVKGKMSDMDYSLVESTNGNILRLQGFKDLEGSINLLAAMYRRDPNNSPEDIPQLELALNTLKKYSHAFEEGFRQKNELVQLVYVNVVVALINATSVMIATTVDYVKDPMGIYKASFKKVASKNRDLNLYLSNLRKFNSYAAKGQLDSFFDATNQYDNVTGIAVVTTAVTVVGVIFLFIWLIREIVYLYFHSRSALAAYLRHQAEFVKLNSSTLGGEMKGARQKQEGVANKLMEIADKIAVEQKVGNRKAVVEIQRESNDYTVSSVSDEGAFL